MSRPSVLITGASAGIGAGYADRFARRGHDLVLVARDEAKLHQLADRLRRATGVAVDVVRADLTVAAELATVEHRLASDARIGILVNNAGGALPGKFVDQAVEDVDRLIQLNLTAAARLIKAVTPRFVAAGAGSIINLASVVALAPELTLTVYGATKAFLLYLSQGLQLELGPRGVYVQAVLPAAIRTAIWDKAGVDVNTLQGVMSVDDLVDAALAGFDRKELITIPPLPDESAWKTFEAARTAMGAGFYNSQPAPRYRG
ncbi:MAG TPA: SDR family oxidoreductase [Kofleriaceae bacterium]|nr:SDR family oxidoreductase [Kofleriaceae bacterium]